MTIADKLKELGLTLPPPPAPAGTYRPVVRTGNLLYLSGQTGKYEGTLHYPGRLGDGVSVDEAYESARYSMVNLLANLGTVAPNLEDIVQVVKVVGFVNSAPSFGDQPKVVNGATDLLREVFGDMGVPARSALGVAALPSGACVEVEMVVELKG